jgi:carbon storage regulator
MTILLFGSALLLWCLTLPQGGKAMLVLTRKVDEAIVIAGKVRVVVAEVRGETVRLGVQAPHHIAVDREEIHLRKMALSRGPPEVFTQQEYDLLADQANCEPALFCGRQMYLREGPVLALG